MLFLLFGLVAAEPSPVARDIEAFCKAEPMCVAIQQKSLGDFLNLMAVSGVTQDESEQCMRSGKNRG